MNPIVEKMQADKQLIALWPLAASDPRWCRSPYGLQTELHDGECEERLKTPWGAEAPVLNGVKHITVKDDPAFHTQEFTFESWIAFQNPPCGCQTLAELSGDEGLAWRLWFNDHLELEFIWNNDLGESKHVTSIQMADVLLPGSWLHVAAAFRNHCNTGQPYIQDYSRVHLYCTPYGERFPRLVGALRGFEKPQISEKSAMLRIGSDGSGKYPLNGAVSNAALTGRAKLDNEFPILGQQPPDNLRFSCNFPAGSVFYPVQRDQHDIVLGCKPYRGSGNYWFYTQVNGEESVIGKKTDMTVLPVPGGGSMLCSMFVSYDRKRWQRIPNGYYRCDRGSPFGGYYSFTQKFQKFPAWLCTYIPYTIDDIDRLENDLKSSDLAEVLVPARSVEGRPVKLFKLTDPGIPDQNKKVVYLQAGQHSPAEQSPGRVLDSAARYLVGISGSSAECPLSPGDISDLLRETVFLFVPILNVDCGFHGGNGVNRNGTNTNRDWVAAGQPEVAGMMSFLKEWMNGGKRIDLALDLHAGGIWKNHTVLAIEEDSNEYPLPLHWFGEQKKFLCALDAHTEISSRDARFRRLTEGTFAFALSVLHGITALCVEFSQMTYRDRSGITRAVTQDHLERLGPQTVKACKEFLVSPEPQIPENGNPDGYPAGSWR